MDMQTETCHSPWTPRVRGLVGRQFKHKLQYDVVQGGLERYQLCWGRREKAQLLEMREHSRPCELNGQRQNHTRVQWGDTRQSAGQQPNVQSSEEGEVIWGDRRKGQVFLKSWAYMWGLLGEASWVAELARDRC